MLISAIAALVFTFIFYYFSKAKLKKSVNSESQFAYLMIFTSCAVAFAHGSNDVANAIGPLAAINQATSQILNQPYFSAQLAAALTVVIASQLDMPVSTTHTLVGAVIGIGLVEGASTINFNSVRTIVLSWVVTLPAGALLSIAFLELFTNLFTY